MSFTHLQVRSGYSLLESTITIEKLVKTACDLKFQALALTDKEVLYGTIPFYKTCVENGIKPIIGMVVDVIHSDEKKEECILLAKNNNGYKQLVKISTMIQRQKQSGIQIKDLQIHTKDLIGILPANTSKFKAILKEKSRDLVRSYVEDWQALFKTNDFYIGVQDHGLVSEHDLLQSIKSFHVSYGIAVVAINDVRYLNEQDNIAYEYLQSIKEDKNGLVTENHIWKHHHLRSTNEMKDLFGLFWPEVLRETEAIQRKCNVTFDFQTRWMPSFPVPDAVDAHTYLEEICWENMEQKYEKKRKEVSSRLTYELNLIKEMRFSDYFLIVWDFVGYAKNNDILVGPGRGSAAGSIVAYVLGITDVDPIKYNLLFERFLNPERLTMPDIDIDFSDQRRNEVIDYVRSKYGEEHVAQIITFGTFGARSLLRELFKTMEIDHKDTIFVLNHIPAQANKPIAEYVKGSAELKDYIKQSKELRMLFSVATRLEGLPRHISTHAAGVVISDEPLLEHVPLTIGANETNLTQFAMNELEDIGLLKIDFLGLKNLTFLERIIQSISNVTNENLALNDIPDNDYKTFELLQQGNTNGIFQLESQGMKQVLTKLKPTSFEDIVAVNALYRPGPMDYISTYINRKHGKLNVSYPHPDLTSILSKTYGVLIYQEQIMKIANKIAGLSLGQADVLRRAISKKDEKLIREQKDTFVQGCLHNGYEQEVSEKIFLWIVKFSNYGFNRSHAVAYSKISYQLAFLKAHYPRSFFTELLNSVANQEEKVYQYINEAKHLQMSILPPSINHSFGKYTVEKKAIRMGFRSIKGIGQHVVKEIMDIRKNRPFSNFFDFCLRVSLKVINRKILELLIMAGAFDELYTNRASLLASIDKAMDQGELFGGLSDLPSRYGISGTYTQIEDYSQMKKIKDEKELLGIYVSNHPLEEKRKVLTLNGCEALHHAKKLVGKRNIKSVVIIHTVKEIRTKRGDPMAFISIGDETGDMEAVVFPELYRNKKRWLIENDMIIITGKIEQRRNQIQWILSGIQSFDSESLKDSEQLLFIKITKDNTNQALNQIKKVSLKYPGNTPIIIYHKEEKRTYKLTQEYYLNPKQDCMQHLFNYFGETNVVLEKK